MTKKDIKYGLRFQSLSSKPGSHMPVSVMFGNIVHLPLAVLATYLGGMFVNTK